jgi:Fur family ferric uptake transcriptional regulator
MEEILKHAGVRVTDFRIKLLSVINSKEFAVSSAEIEKSIGEFDRVTLYRTLKTFKEKGLIHEVNMENEPVKYATCSDTCSSSDHRHEHIHFKCTSCLKVTCEDLPSHLHIDLDGFTLESLEIQAKGICKNCNN